MTTETNEIVWRPTPEVAERSRIARFMRAQRIGSLAELQRPLRRRSRVVLGRGRARSGRALEPALHARARRLARGRRGRTWFPGGRLNFTDNCVDRHVDAGRGGKPAIVWEGDDGQSRTLTYAELAGEVNRLANGLKALGVGEGDRVGIFLPMSPEAAIATLAVVKIGAIYTPCFSGFGAGAVASRLSDCEAKAADHRRRLLPARPGREDEGDRRRGGGAVPVGRSTCWSTGGSDARSRGRPDATAGGTRPSPGRATVPRRCRSRPIARASSSTRRARRDGRRARCSPTAASSSRPRTTSATAWTSARATGCSG